MFSVCSSHSALMMPNAQASNTPASVFGMVLKSRVLSTQLQIIPQRPHVDLRQRAERRGMTIHPVEAMLYVLATAAECRVPEQ